MTGFRIVVTDDRYGVYKEENEVLSEIGSTVEVHNFTSSEDAMKTLRDADAVLNNLFPLGAEIIRGMRRCKVISRYGVGYDNVDVAAATTAGIWVTRVPDYCVEEVSDHALALLLGCVRGVSFRDRRVRQGEWNLSRQCPSHRLAGTVLGLLGYGAIARALHRKVAGLGLARVIAHDPFVPETEIRASGAEPVRLPTLLSESDILSLHAPLTAETRGMISHAELEVMKATAILVNTSRGPLVEESALAEALRKHTIAGAGLDVFSSEPLSADSPLRGLENAILTDHCGWYSEESVVELKGKAAMNVLAVLKGGIPRYPVNAPAVLRS